MKKQKSGSIINIASAVGVKPVKKIPIYGVSYKLVEIDWDLANVSSY